MEQLVINGGRKLFGEVEISAAKNACLPLISATLAFSGEFFLTEVPKIVDVTVMCELLREYGVECKIDGRGLKINSESARFCEPQKERSKKIRASLFFLGAALSRFKKAVVYKPGGCDIGSRPIDIHLSGLKSLGVKFIDEGERFSFDGKDMHASSVFLRYPSVGATINIIEAAIFLKGETVIKNAAREPEISCLCDFLNGLGCKIKGAGSSLISIYGVEQSALKNSSPIEFSPIKDRIEAATFIAAVCACGGEIAFKTEENDIKKCVEFFKARGATIKSFKQKKSRLSKFYVKSEGNLLGGKVTADVYPAIPTDMQPIIAASLINADGRSMIVDKVYPERFLYAKELKKFGANIYEVVSKQGAIRISKPKFLVPAVVCANDLRGGAALCVAALAIFGESVICGAEKIRRGYERLDEKLALIGACAKYVN